MNTLRHALYLLLLTLVPLQFALATAGHALPLSQARTISRDCHSASPGPTHPVKAAEAASIAAHCLQHCLTPIPAGLPRFGITRFSPVWSPVESRRLISQLRAPPLRPPPA